MIEHGFHIERAQGAQVNDLGFDPSLESCSAAFIGKIKTLTVGDDGEVFAFALYFGFSNGNGYSPSGTSPRTYFCGGMFDEENRIIRPDG